MHVARNRGLHTDARNEAHSMAASAPSVLVICAMESEAVHLRRRLTSPEEVRAASVWRMTRGSLHGAEVSVLVCGVGEACAAAGIAAVLAGGWRPRAVLNYGCAGAHDASIREGDVVRCSPLHTCILITLCRTC
jgi:nucleoside phosphorylase